MPSLPRSPPQLVEAAEAKAYYGLAVNYRALTALAKELMEQESMTGAEVRALLEREGEEGRSLGNSFGVAQPGGWHSLQVAQPGGVAQPSGGTAWGGGTAWELFLREEGSTSCKRLGFHTLGTLGTRVHRAASASCMHIVTGPVRLPNNCRSSALPARLPA